MLERVLYIYSSCHICEVLWDRFWKKSCWSVDKCIWMMPNFSPQINGYILPTARSSGPLSTNCIEKIVHLHQSNIKKRVLRVRVSIFSCFESHLYSLYSVNTHLNCVSIFLFSYGSEWIQREISHFSVLGITTTFAQSIICISFVYLWFLVLYHTERALLSLKRNLPWFLVFHYFIITVEKLAHLEFTSV